MKNSLTEHGFFKKLYDNLRLPVIVAENTPSFPVVYINTEAQLYLSLSISVRRLKNRTTLGDFSSILRLDDRQTYDDIEAALKKHGSINELMVTMISYDKEVLSAELSANILEFNGTEYVLFYVRILDVALQKEEAFIGELLSRILHEAYNSKSTAETIQSILSLAGRRLNVSRVYVFEDISPEYTRNTYEWCADGVEPAIQLLQHLKKEDYQYDVIMANPMFIYNDTRELPKRDREILYDLQGIKSIAILPLYQFDKPIGYLGFDDTAKFRKWTRREIQVQEGIASILASLISRRNTEDELIASREAMQTITDNLDDLIFVNDLKTYELKFVSKSLANSLGLEAKDLVGQPCWSVVQPGHNEPCDFCPIPVLYEKDGEAKKDAWVWEHYNENTGKWYLIKDNIIKWIDGSMAHLETATDITYQKQYEEQLKYSASTDAMTEVYNREWGYAKLKEIAENQSKNPDLKHTLCFIDIDGLKSVNDHLGHAAGDEMIVNTIKTIFACIRKEDFICRWGGDEFILLLFCDIEMAAKVNDKINFAIEHFNQTRKKEYTLSISTGAVEIKPDSEIDDVIAEADRLMYQAKALKKSRRKTTSRVTRFFP